MFDRWAALLSVVKVLPLAWVCTVATSANASDLTWFAGDSLRAQAHTIVAEMRSAESYGLDSRRYVLGIPADHVQKVLEGDDVEDAIRERFDEALIRAVAQFLSDLRHGRVTPASVGFHLQKMPDPFVADVAARDLASASDVHAAIAVYEPAALPYRRLKAALADYRKLAQREDLSPPSPPMRRSIREGDSYDGAHRLRQLLLALGDLEQGTCTEASAAVFDACLAQAIRRFQARHGLVEDGILGPRTRDALGVPLRHRVRQIELTMERWRWTSTLQRPDILVNVPQFVLYALPRSKFGETDAIEMRVIVGQSADEMRTPVFAEAIEYVIFQPFWDVPSSITRRELLPLIRKDPSYLARNDMEIVRGWSDNAAPIPPSAGALEELAAGKLRLRQRPGSKNALGSVKFMLPNPHNVYLHATPNIDLFEQPTRAFSHGCIRVSNPALLAEYVLKHAAGDWSAEAVEAALCEPTTKRVDLKTPIPVLIFYGTAVTTSRGTLFFEDIYGHDQRLDRLLRQVVSE